MSIKTTEKAKRGIFRSPKRRFRKIEAIWGMVAILFFLLPGLPFLLGRFSNGALRFDPAQVKVNSLKFDSADGSRIEFRVKGRGVVVSSGVLVCHGVKYKFGQATELALSPCPTVKIALPLLDGTNLPVYENAEERWHSAIRRATIKSNAQYFLSNVLIPNSVCVKDIDLPAEHLQPKDAVTNLVWALPGEYYFGPDNMILINRLDRDDELTEIFKVTDKLSTMQHAACVVYEAKTRRIDTVCLGRSGKFEIVSGTASEFYPSPPVMPEGFFPLVNVMAPVQNEDIRLVDLCAIKSLQPERIADAVKKRNHESLSRVRRKLESGGPIKVLFYGDSITCGGSVMDPHESFPDLFMAKLKNNYAHSRINFINRGMGQTSASTRYLRFQEEVLSEHPDLLVIEFINDYRANSELVDRAYKSILNEAKAAGIDVILCTPHLLNPLCFGYASWQKMASHPYINQVRALSKQNGVALCDLALRWQHCQAEGTPPNWLLTDGVIHLNERGHQIYAEELLRCFD